MTTRELAKELNTSPVTVSTAFRILQQLPKIVISGGHRSAFWSEDQINCLKNYLAIKKAFPGKNINELQEMEKEILAAGFNHIFFSDVVENPLVTDKRFYKMDFFPSAAEITPFQFMDL